MGYILRQAGPNDFDQISALITLGAQIGSVLPRDADELRGVLTCFFVIEIEGQIVAIASLEEYAIVTPRGAVIVTGRLAEIRSLVVASEHQGQGYGAALIRACLQEALKRGIARVIAVTDKADFFAKFGFVGVLGHQTIVQIRSPFGSHDSEADGN